jgi:VanZ family protein
MICRAAMAQRIRIIPGPCIVHGAAVWYRSAKNRGRIEKGVDALWKHHCERLRNGMKKPPWRHWLFYGGPVLACAAMIFYLSSLTRFPEELPSFFGFDKLLHFFEYYPLGWLICRWLVSAERPFFRKHAILLTLVAGIAYGLSDEWHQSFVPGRDASLWDALFDALGVAAAAFTYPILRRRVDLLRKLEDRLGKWAFHE